MEVNMNIDNINIVPIIDNTDTGKIVGVTIVAPPGYAFNLSKTNIQGNQFKCIFQRIDQNTEKP